MLNPRLEQLPDHTWGQLRALLDPFEPAQVAGRNEPLNLTIGEPRHPKPDFVTDILQATQSEYSKYPPIQGTPAWQDAVANWLARRYGLADINADDHLLPVSGTREGLFMAAFVAVPNGISEAAPLVLMPNPLYQCYAAAALCAGGEPIYVAATAETGFLPDFCGLPDSVLDRTALIYLCTPANPQGAVASQAYFEALVTMVRARDITLIVDECYAEIYIDAPPLGVLQACTIMAQNGDKYATGTYANILAFHSLSKRSNLPGLRSGFVAGDPVLIGAYRKLRSYGGNPSPLPVYAAAAAAWNDEVHVEDNRRLYRAKFDMAEAILKGQFCYYRPGGGFYLWLDVEDGELAAKRLWREAGVRVLPGRYLARDDSSGYNPGAAYIRVALVQPLEATEQAFELIVSTLGTSRHPQPPPREKGERK